MQTIGFVGTSGTGKSYRSLYVAQQNQIKYIIDDGLLLDAKSVIAGKSAKKEKTKIASVKRALFTEEEHIKEVKEAIKKNEIDKILILGTSKKMISHIANALDLPEISQFIHIEDVATPEEIATAQRVRREQGKHVIPVPTFEIKKDFSGYFIDKVKIFLKYGKNQQDTFHTEKTVVRPTYSYLGEYHISNQVILSLAKLETEKISGVAQYFKTTVHSRPEGVSLTIEFSVSLGRHMEEIARDVQKAVKNSIEHFTSINVLKIDVIIKSIEVCDGSKDKKRRAH